jgi:hypothetical protein
MSSGRLARHSFTVARLTTPTTGQNKQKGRNHTTPRSADEHKAHVCKLRNPGLRANLGIEPRLNNLHVPRESECSLPTPQRPNTRHGCCPFGGFGSTCRTGVQWLAKAKEVEHRKRWVFVVWDEEHQGEETCCPSQA